MSVDETAEAIDPAVDTTADTDPQNACSNTSINAGNISSPISLRSAVCAVNNSGSGSFTITVPPGTYSLSLGELPLGRTSGANISITGTGTPANTIIHQTDGVNRIFEQDPPLTGNIAVSISNVTISGGNASGFGGGAILGGGVGADNLTLTNVVIDSNATATTDAGGGVNFGSSGTFTIIDSTFSNNTATDAPGGALQFSQNANAGSLSITNSIFTNNKATSTAGTLGGALSLLPDTGNTVTITGSTFTGNQALGASGEGGAIYAVGAVTVSNSRIVGNIATSGSGFFESGGAGNTGTAINNWWGCNAGPNNSGCDHVDVDLSSIANFNPWLVLSINASPNQIQTPGTSTLTADLTHNSASTGGFSVPDGTPVTFGGTLGSASPTSTTLTSGQQTSTFTAGGTAGHGTGTATVDNQPVSTPIEILDTVNFDTSPTGLSYTVDSVTYTSPQTFHWVVGSTHPVSTSTPQAGPAGSQYVFANWSDGLGISHNITAPTASTSYTATFNTQYQLTTQASPPGDGTVTPTSGGFYDPGASIAVSATPANAGFIFNNWTSSGGAFDSATSASTNFHMPAAAATVTGNFSAVVTAAGTTTTLTSNNNPSFTTAPNNSVTFTATVTSSAVPVTEGTVTFKEGATTLSGPTALDGSGHASFTTSSLPEGSHLINAVYNGTVNFLTSNGSYTQTVNNHTVVTGNQYCNPGAVTLSNTAASASPYPSQIFVSGAGSSVTNVTLALNHIGSGDVQAMNLLLIDPNGKKFVPFAHAGDPTTISNVDVTLDDAASSGLPNGATLVSGTFKPSSYSGSAISFASPAPAGPYDYAASDGVATLASEFNGTNPNGTWQLYAETSTTGGSGSISGGWCLNIATTATPPDLSIAKTHSGNFTQGQSGTYHIVVTNNGPSPTSGTVTVTDTMPAGLTVSAVVSGAQWSCLGSTTTTVSCTSTSVVAATDSYGAIDVTVHVDANAPATVTNTATVSGSGDVTPANNSSNDPTTINPTPADLTITKTHGGSFTQGQTGATYTITVTNSGHATTSGTVTVTDTLPSGLTATAMSGTGWTCTLGTLTCTNTNPLTATSSYNAITLTVNVAANATSPQVNSATVSGGGETNTANDTATDSTTIGNGPDLTITKTHVGNFTQRQTGAQYTITVTNSGGATTSGTVTVADTLPSGLTATAISGTGWTCTLGTLTCTNTTALAASSSYNAITLTVNVAANATSPQVNSVTVSGGNESNTANDTATDSTNIQAGPDLTITKSHSGNFTQGQTGATYTITVKNIGSTTSGTVNVADALPAGLTATALSGSGWSCTVTPLACSRSTALANNLSYPSITLTVNVASNAPSSVINSATVSGGGESNTANDTASDPTTVNPFVPSFSVSPGSLIFGDVNLGSRKDLTVTVHNTGSSPLNVTGVSLTPGSGPARNDYGYDTECDTVKPGKSCTIEVELHAQDLGSGTATLNIFYNQPGSPAHVSLSGNVINPRARLQPDHLDFGTVQVGHSSVKTATLTSTGDTPLLIVGPDINGSTDFKQTSNCPSSLAPGNSCTITVTFKPSSKTTKSATLRAFDNATGSPQTSALTGKGN